MKRLITFLFIYACLLSYGCATVGHHCTQLNKSYDEMVKDVEDCLLQAKQYRAPPPDEDARHIATAVNLTWFVLTGQSLGVTSKGTTREQRIEVYEGCLENRGYYRCSRSENKECLRRAYYRPTGEIPAIKQYEFLKPNTVAYVDPDIMFVYPEPIFMDLRKAIVKLCKGAELIVIAKIINENGECWYKARTPDGQIGWVRENWISTEPPQN